MGIKIITDSACDLTKEYRIRKYRVSIINIKFKWEINKR